MDKQADNQKILEKLGEIKSELDFIKDHMIDVDMILTEKEKADLDKSLKEFKQGKTFSLKDIKRDRDAI